MTFAGSAAWLLHALTHSLACSHSLTSTHIQTGITRPQQHAWLPRRARGQHNKAPPTPRAPLRVSHPVPLSLFLFSPPYLEHRLLVSSGIKNVTLLPTIPCTLVPLCVTTGNAHR